MKIEGIKFSRCSVVDHWEWSLYGTATGKGVNDEPHATDTNLWALHYCRTSVVDHYLIFIFFLNAGAL